MGDDDFLKRLETERDDLKSKNNQLNMALSSASYQGQEEPNLIQFQIDTGELLAMLEHFLRGERLMIDADGNENWEKPKKMITKENGETEEVVADELILFNEYGVNSILSEVGKYLNKNTFLSFYDEMRINEIMGDLGDELAKFIFCNYERMGLDTEFKKTRYELTVLSLLHLIESAYRRALRGKTMEDLNSSRIFTQMDNLSRGNAPVKKKFNLFKPGTW